MDEDAKAKRYMWCFWIAVIIIFVVFVLPVETHEAGNITINYTIWNKITGSNSGGEIRLNH